MAGWKLRKDKTQAEAPDAANPTSASLTEATPEDHTPPAGELPDELLPLPAAHWEMPADNWAAPAAEEPLKAMPVEDEPVFAEEIQHKEMPFVQAEPEELHYRFAPLNLGTSDLTDTAPRFDTEDEEEDSEPAPHFDDDEEIPAEVIDLAAMPVERKEIAMPPSHAEPEVLAAPEPEITPEPEMVAAPEPEMVPIAEPKATAEPKKRILVAKSSAAGEPEANPAPEPEIVAAPEPEIVAAPEPEIVAATPPVVEAAPEVIPAPPVTPEPEAIAAPMTPAAPAAPLFSMPAPASPEIAAAPLRLDRSELPSAIPPPSGFSVPPVSPFLLDVPQAPVQETPHTLLVRIGRLSATFEMTKEVTVIGRPDSDLHFYPDIEIEMDDAVSRRHAEILRHEDDYYLVDAASTNGTLLNGELLKPHEERKLAHGDRIRVGERTEIIFE